MHKRTLIFRIASAALVLGFGVVLLGMTKAWAARSSGPLDQPEFSFAGQPADCSAALDLMLVLDGSGSISDVPPPGGGLSEWQTLVQFAVDLTESFKVSTNSAHIGVVQFSSFTRLEIALSDNQQAVVNAIENMVQYHDLTDIAGGINRAQIEFNAHGRAGVPQAMIVVTDGVQTVAGDPVVAATTVKAKGKKIFSVGVGDSISTQLLSDIASDPDDQHVFFVDQFDQLVEILDELVDVTCPPTATPSLTKTPTSTPTATPTPSLTPLPPTSTPTNTP
ncbi:MAG: VWA domain-containing protein, partial [Dehalococcoidia bacterium]